MAQSSSSEMQIPDGVKVVGGIILAIILLIGLFTSWVTVPAGHRGVVMHWGKVQTTVLDEGLYFTCPFMTSVKKLSVRVNKNEVQASAASKDMQTVTSQVAINWHLKSEDVQKIYQSIGDENTVVENILTPAVNEVFKSAISKKKAEEILSMRTELKSDVDRLLNERLTRYNVFIDDISIVDIQFSKEFNDAIEAKQVAEQNAQKAVYEAQQKKAEAEGNINQARGQAESQRLVQGSLSTAILMKAAIDKWDGHYPTVMGSGSLPLLDLRKLQNGVKATAQDNEQ